MEMQSSIGGLIPIWILGAPLVAGLVLWITMPKAATRHDTELRSTYPQRSY